MYKIKPYSKAFLIKDQQLFYWGFSNLSPEWYAMNDKDDTPVYNICDCEEEKGVIVFSEVISSLSFLNQISKLLQQLQKKYKIKRCLLWVEKCLIDDIDNILKDVEGKKMFIYETYSDLQQGCDIYMHNEVIQS